GRIEQMGTPVELYESPRTVFVANFLGQSNLVMGTVVGSDGSDLQVSVHGNKISVPASRNFAKDNSEKSVLIGIRPEKISIEHAEANSFGGGVITDISFVGVSTQFQIQMPWGQELSVFEQNDGGASHLQKGDTVTLSWKPSFTFALDGRSDVDAGTSVNPDEL
ncbi:MAG: TOBE domain-containing protein, partial [Actinobacteria bacterium]|nr:TOBE domain-containing protein [Actinomycetota bacterium]